MAYYPDGRQEQLFAAGGYAQWAELMHMMAYDQSGGHHSSLEFGRKVAKQGAEMLPPAQVTLGLPFYGRSSDSVSPLFRPRQIAWKRSIPERLCWGCRGTG